MPTTQIRSALVLGNLPGIQPAAGTLALNAANTWLAFGFTPSESKTLSKVKIYCTTATASLAATDLTCDVYSTSSSGAPNASLSSTSTVTTTPTNLNTPMWVEFTGLTQAVTASVPYWLVFKNANGSPSTVNATYQWLTGGTTGVVDAISSTNPWNKKSTTDGSTWGSAVTGYMGVRLEYSDGSFDGTPIQASATTTVGDGVYSARELGSFFTLPANASLNVRGLIFVTSRTGTPTGLPVFKIRSGDPPGSPIATSVNIGSAASDLSNTGIHYGYFASPVNLIGGTIYRVTVAESSQSDASTNRYGSMVLTIENDANSKALTLFGSCQKTYFDGTSTWTQTATDYVPFGLILDSDTPFL